MLADNDAHTTDQEKWSYDVQSKKLKILNMENGLVQEYEVMEIEEDVLKVKA